MVPLFKAQLKVWHAVHVFDDTIENWNPIHKCPCSDTKYSMEMPGKLCESFTHYLFIYVTPLCCTEPRGPDETVHRGQEKEGERGQVWQELPPLLLNLMK